MIYIYDEDSDRTITGTIDEVTINTFRIDTGNGESYSYSDADNANILKAHISKIPTI